MNDDFEADDFTRLTDLAAARLGGRAVLTNDEFFAPKENLVKDTAPVFLPGEYTDRGKWMDGWESRRRRTPGNDWCIVQLGAPGRIIGVGVETTHFSGNHPESCSIEACRSTDEIPADGTEWQEILARSALNGDAVNRFRLASPEALTHVRLNIYPDGGVARLRLYGIATPVPGPGGSSAAPTDLAAATGGANIVDCSDMYFSAPQNLIAPGASKGMHDGWETRRRRGPGHDWCIVRLGQRGSVEAVVVETTHFKGNYPDRCSLDMADSQSVDDPLAPVPATAWRPLVSESKLEADGAQRFDVDEAGIATHVRLNIFPDGGVARLRVFGRPDE